MNLNASIIVKQVNIIRSRAIVKDSISTTIYGAIGKGGGFLIPFLIGIWFGVSERMDAFFFAYSLIMFIAMIFSPVVENIIVPFVVDSRLKGEDVGEFVGKMLGVSAVILSIISILFIVIVRPLLALSTNLSPDGIKLASTILCESAPLLVLIIWTSILAGTFNAFKLFKIAAISPCLRAAAAVTFIFIFKKSMGIHSIAIGYVVGEIFRLCILLILIKRLNIFTLKISFSLDNKFKSFLKVSIYQIAGMSVLALTPIINKAMVSWLGPGNVSILEYADRLYMMPVTLLTSGFVITLLAHWSERINLEGNVNLRKDIKNAVKTIGFIGLLVTTILFVLKGMIVKIIYGHGQFSKERLYDVEMLFGYYVLGLTPYLLSQVYARALMCNKNTKALFYISLIMIISTILFNHILINALGLKGIALSYIFVYVLGCCVAYKMTMRMLARV